ncbi:hypothetical protein DOE76_01075 [Leifsonia sp. ku-ls]|nr:hypothetical protein DOE76_01075 [Leifsonia sp. ku-ls]
MDDLARKPTRRHARSKRDVWIEQRYGRAALEAEWARVEAMDAPRRAAASVELGRQWAERAARVPRQGRQLRIVA